MKYCELPFTKKWNSLSEPINVVDEETSKEQVVDTQCVPHIREIMQNGLHSFGCKPFTSFSSLDHAVITYHYTSQFSFKLEFIIQEMSTKILKKYIAYRIYLFEHDRPGSCVKDKIKYISPELWKEFEVISRYLFTLDH